MTLKNTISKRKEISLRKIKNFCSLKDTVTRIKTQATDLEKIVGKHISDKGLASRIYKVLPRFNKKNEVKNFHSHH